MITSRIAGADVELREEHDFNWVNDQFSRPFCVFDQQDSGNLSFGCVDIQTNRRVFVKYAGARPKDFDGEPREAIARLHRAAEVYTDLQPHEHLIPMEKSFSTDNGFVMVFQWFDNSECLHPHWSHPPPGKYTDVRSPYYRFRQLSLKQRLDALDDVFTFLEYVDRRDYVAIDFYDGNMLYNFETNVTKICDIDFFEKMPCRPSQPPWGSPRYLASEENQPDAILDHRTNVFRMGAWAFGLLGGELDRSLSRWDANEQLHTAALRAIASNPLERQSNVQEFLSEWRSGVASLKSDINGGCD
jgi:serine/threonine-protein kinase